MIKYFIIFILFCLTFIQSTFSQNRVLQFDAIDNYVNTTPDSVTHDIKNLATYLTSPFDSDTDKVRAIYFWVSNNISYSLRKMKYQRTFSDSEEIIDVALKSRKCVCQGYAELFHALCFASGIESFVVPGYVKLDGIIEDYSHAWNAAKINKDWYLFDPTWGSGYVSNNRFYPSFNNDYYMIEPKIFIQTHIPFDLLWQFQYHPKTHKDFYLNTSSDTNMYFNFDDTIAKYYCPECPDLQRRHAAYNRIVNSGIVNDMILEEAEQARLNIAISLNNYAGELLNQAIDRYNIYITAKNNGFKDTDTDMGRMELLLNDCERDLDEAWNIFSSVQTNDKGLINSLHENLKIVNDLSSNVHVEQRFLNIYLKKNHKRRE